VAIGGTGIGLASMAFAFAIYLLEIFVGFLQAFIFMFLTTIFIGQLSHHGDGTTMRPTRPRPTD
jgi:F-type H+-transporting ATPase subunit a